jgi:hypothetical protein
MENSRILEVGLSSFLIPFSKDDRWNLLRFVVVASDFCYASDYTMASDMFLLVIDFIKG